MNIYICWYKGVLGYCCSTGPGLWMFVPELGQVDHRIHKNIALSELSFKHHYEKVLELKREESSAHNPFLAQLKILILPRTRPRTVGGLLLGDF